MPLFVFVLSWKMSSAKWDNRYLLLAADIAKCSKDPKRKVGCILADSENRIMSSGYNGPPAELDDIPEDRRLIYTVHAELNALLFTSRNPHTCYVWPFFPCSQCMGALAQRKVKRVVSIQPPSEKWNFQATRNICNKLGIDLVQIQRTYR